MDNYSQLFEKMNEQETPEDTLMVKIAGELEQMITALEGDYWFHSSADYSETDVLEWLKENRPEFYRKALEQPETVEGSDVITDALKALDLMKEWHEVESNDIQTPEEERRWKDALSHNDEE